MGTAKIRARSPSSRAEAAAPASPLVTGRGPPGMAMVGAGAGVDAKAARDAATTTARATLKAGIMASLMLVVSSA
jgi:hypothetical protein